MINISEFTLDIINAVVALDNAPEDPDSIRAARIAADAVLIAAKEDDDEEILCILEEYNFFANECFLECPERKQVALIKAVRELAELI